MNRLPKQVSAAADWVVVERMVWVGGTLMDTIKRMWEFLLTADNKGCKYKMKSRICGAVSGKMFQQICV